MVIKWFNTCTFTQVICDMAFRGKTEVGPSFIHVEMYYCLAHCSRAAGSWLTGIITFSYLNKPSDWKRDFNRYS